MSRLLRQSVPPSPALAEPGNLDPWPGSGTRGATSARGVVLQTEGRILVAGRTGPSSQRDALLVRYNLDGSLDTMVGRGGVGVQVVSTDNDEFRAVRLVATPIGTSQDEIRAMLLVSDRLVVRIHADDRAMSRRVILVPRGPSTSEDTNPGFSWMATHGPMFESSRPPPAWSGRLDL